VTSRQRLPLVLVVLILGAVATGAAAAAIISAPSSTTTGGTLSPYIPISVIGWLLIVVAAAAIGLFIYNRLTTDSAAFPGRIVATVLIGMMLMIAFVILAHLLNTGWSGFLAGQNGTLTQNNSSSTGVVGGNISTNVTGTGGTVQFLGFAVPSWVPLTVLVAVALIIALIAAPPISERVQRMREDRLRSRAHDQQVAEARAALADAGRALDEGSDPRQVIQALYARLLVRVGAIVKGMETETPEEIRALHLLDLGIRPESAADLTRLFEEARYSTHPLTSDAADRARSAIRAAEEDLDRRMDAR
jgi:hypothetical protein